MSARGRRAAVSVLVVAVLVGGCSAGANDPPGSVPATAIAASSATTSSQVRPSSTAATTASAAATAVPTVVTTVPTTTAEAAAPAAAVGPTAPASESPATGFISSIAEIDPSLAARMSSSWRPGCPVPLSDLRYLTLTYRGFDGADHSGELVVAASVADDVTAIFGELYTAGYPIESLRLVDDFGGSDDDSMAADNSSAFNCRAVTGGGGFSEHSYGTAIDLNPVQNPYLSGTLALPEAGRAYLERRPQPGVIEPGDAVVQAFAERGWSWGGEWSGPIDYQHFSVSGR